MRIAIRGLARVLGLMGLLAVGGAAQAAGSDAHNAQQLAVDAKRHRAMAAAHEAMAACLESRKPQSQCLADLQAACKGLGIGKYCGMKHEH